MRYIIIEQVGSAYWMENGNLMCAPLSNDNTFDTTDGYEPEEDLIGDEQLPEPYGNATTFSELYRRIKTTLLQAKTNEENNEE